jgi:hypothetical protein
MMPVNESSVMFFFVGATCRYECAVNRVWHYKERTSMIFCSQSNVL